MTELPPAIPSTWVPAPPLRPQRLFFTGSGGEYFRIWIVNLLLTIVTLGIYSAWAKVRTLCYFYRHTRLAGASFDYHGQPLAILKGRIVGVLMLGGYYAAGLISPEASGVAFIVLIAALPFFIVRALRFRLHNSSYRGLRFRFAGGTAAAYRVFLGLGLASALTLFALLPLWVQRQVRYVRHNALFGRTPFTFDAPVSGFYRIYLLALAAGIGVVAVISVLLVGIVGIAVVSGVETDGGTASPAAAIGIILVAAAYVLGSVGVWSFISARVQNLSWNHTRLGPHQFRCELRARSLMWITLTNLLGIVLTLGLYKPFAEVRLMKYVASTFTLVPAGSLDEFMAGEQQHVAAVGEEAVEMFDVDLAI
jgi:uncharacterized membrane protein YjgN (DUF898 family)